MSLEVKNNDKMFLASGDNAKNTKELPRKLRKTAIPSSRRFGTRSLSNESNVAELQKAIEELSSPNIRKKSLTLAEITPTRSNRIDESDEIISPRKNKQFAGRIIYEAILLYSWRKRKTNISNLTESLRALESQNRKLDLQIDALHRLRIAESEKRNEAVVQTQKLTQENEEILHKNATLQQEKQLLVNEADSFREKITEMEVQYKNIKNELITKHNDLENSEYQLNLQRRKTKRLISEKQCLEEQEAFRKCELQDYIKQIDDLQEKLLILEVNLQDSIVCNDNYKKEKQELLEKCETESSANRRLQDHNEKLKSCLFAINKVLKKEQNRPWWKNVGELGFSFLKSLKAVAVILLPVTPYKEVV
ncbi:hypothetical protein FQR65_LT03214 [Abscondita terminalis]|nr:hypothetical protein FQR65_LT03214 [Abscondita terminalis]